MAYTPKIGIAELKKKGFLSEDDFFQHLASENNYMDENSAKQFYMSLVRTVTTDLKIKGVCVLPHMGYFALVKRASGYVFSGSSRRKIEGKYVLKFYPAQKWRDYFSELESRPGIEGKLDSREKLLGRIID